MYLGTPKHFVPTARRTTHDSRSLPLLNAADAQRAAGRTHRATSTESK